MKAPDSVYLALNVFGDVIKDQWQFHRLHDDDIEYIRKDAFIEKAAEWIKNKAENYIVDTPLCSYFDYKRAVEDFKKAQKEE